jgi:hypothetical protein
MKRRAGLAVLFLTVSAFAVARVDRPRSVRVHDQASANTITAFVRVTVVPMDSPRVLPDQVVLVQGERILEMDSSKAVHVPPAAHRIDAHGLFLLPGLADMHVHLMEGAPYLPLFLANGVTIVRNMAGGPEISSLRERVKSGALIGPTIYTAGPILDGSPPVWEGSDVVTTSDKGRRAIEKQKSAGYDFAKVYDNLQPAAYEGIVRAAADLHMSVLAMCHLMWAFSASWMRVSGPSST